MRATRVPAVALGPLLPRRQPRQLGDMLQRLALISPEDVRDLEQVTRMILKHAEARYRKRFHIPLSR